jgi:hypothetical protein
MIIPIQTKDNQTHNKNIITLFWWLNDTNNKKYLKTYTVRNRIMK